MLESASDVGQWLTPNSLTPDKAHVRRLFIPGDIEMLAVVNGALLDLTYPENWELQGTVTPDEAAAAAWTMYQRAQVETWSMIGAIVPSVTADTPPGCLELDGATYNGELFPLLYDVLDAYWLNGDGTFTVPDLRGRFPLALSASHTMGDGGGAETVTLDVSEMPSHNHDIGNTLISAAVMPGEGPVLIPNPIGTVTGNRGGGGAHDNMPPYVALRYVLIAE